MIFNDLHTFKSYSRNHHKALILKGIRAFPFSGDSTVSTNCKHNSEALTWPADDRHPNCAHGREGSSVPELQRNHRRCAEACWLYRRGRGRVDGLALQSPAPQPACRWRRLDSFAELPPPKRPWPRRAMPSILSKRRMPSRLPRLRFTREPGNARHVLPVLVFTASLDSSSCLGGAGYLTPRGGAGTTAVPWHFPLPVLPPVSRPDASRRVPVDNPEGLAVVVWLPVSRPEASRY